VYIAFLRMLGVTVAPPTAARVQLHFWRTGTEDGVTSPENRNIPPRAEVSEHSPVGRSVAPLPRGSLISTAESGLAGAVERPVFITLQDLEIPPGSNTEEKAASVLAYHCERVEEPLGLSRGVAGQSFQVRRPPIVARLPLKGEDRWLDLAVGVEVSPAESRDEDWTGADGKRYRLWREVENFAGLAEMDEAYLVDRSSGLIQFAPAARLSREAELRGEPKVRALGAIPDAGREIRAWYPSGGGEAGNVRARTLTSLVSVPGRAVLPGLQVTNPEPARGGLDTESLENALVRGPQEIYSQHRAVTAREFESIVLRSPYVARARAIAQADLWHHATPGTVDITLVPRLTREQAVSMQNLRANEDLENLGRIEAELRERSPIGIRSSLRWARYKQVWVRAQITFGSNEEAAAIQKRVTERLNRLISPLPVAAPLSAAGSQNGGSQAPGGSASAQAALQTRAGWPFGQQLQVADVYNLILAGEQSKILITSLEVCLEHAPSQDVAALAADSFQPNTWFAGSGGRLFRSTNDGTGWELVLHLDRRSGSQVFRYREGGWAPAQLARDETVRHVRPSHDRPGMVAVSTEVSVQSALHCPLYLSTDCGESWYQLAIIQEDGTELQPGEVEDMAWLMRAGRHVLLLATEGGLLELDLQFGPDGRPELADFFHVPVLLDQPSHPLYALAVVRGGRGSQRVVVSLKGRRGVYISAGDDLAPGQAGLGGTTRYSSFSLLGLQGEDIRHLKVQYQDEHIYLWAAAMALNDNGRGCFCWQFDPTARQADAGVWVSQGWVGGSCLALTFDGSRIYAATAWGGLLRTTFDANAPDRLPVWRRFHSEDLPHRPIQMEGARRDRGLYEPLIAIDARDGVVMAASGVGIYRRLGPEQEFENERYENVSRDTFRNLKDVVTLPPDWLLISGAHDIQARFDSGFGEDEAYGEPEAAGSEQPFTRDAGAPPLATPDKGA
jgi:hypothetical protein